MKSARHPAATRRGFTLIELLVVIGIIVLLIAILLPVVASVRKQAYNTSTQSQMSRIMSACLAYYHDFNAYPGPVANTFVMGGPNPGGNPIPLKGVTSTTGTGRITSSENLVLGLLGFITVTPPSSTGGNPTLTFKPIATQPPTDVAGLNPLHPASYHYLDYVPDELTITGLSKDLEYAAGKLPTDSNVPEFIDRFPDHMPILYTRANVGVAVVSTNPKTIATTNDTAQYNFQELQNYGSYMRNNTGTGTWQLFNQTSVQTLFAKYGANALADDVAVPYQDFIPTTSTATGSYYYINPNIAMTPKGQDAFILISAGKDRTYGTQDDILVTP